MDKVLSIYKPVGKTPLEMITKVREVYPEFQDQSITYVGRLDPMAHGVLILLIGEAAKNRGEYLHLEKSYTFEVLYGVATDTYDILGILRSTKYTPLNNVNIFVDSFVKNHIGTWQQAYPPFSSKPVNGKPLFWWARNGLIDTITIPAHDVTVDAFEVIKHASIDAHTLRERIITHILSVQGDFRQAQTLAVWEEFFKNNDTQQFATTTFSIMCSSGTYVRGIANALGKALGCGAIALDILRTKVGKYDLKNAEKIISQ